MNHCLLLETAENGLQVEHPTFANSANANLFEAFLATLYLDGGGLTSATEFIVC